MSTIQGSEVMLYQIISDSSCDLPNDLIQKNHLKVVPFYVSFDDTNYLKENLDIGVRDFYQKMVDNPKVFPKSSLPSVQDYIECFTPYVKNGIPILCICITTKFSGSYNAASTARDILLEQYKDAKIHVLDSTINTVLQGLFVLEACKMQQAGKSFDEVITRLDEIKSSGRILFTIANIDYLKHGGRIGKLAGLAASTLGIKPLIVLKEGEIFTNGITRSRKKALGNLIDQTKEHFSNLKESPDDYSIAVGYGYDYEEACAFRDELLASLKTYSNITELPIYQIGSTIGVHTGPHPLGLGLIKRWDAN